MTLGKERELDDIDQEDMETRDYRENRYDVKSDVATAIPGHEILSRFRGFGLFQGTTLRCSEKGICAGKKLKNAEAKGNHD